MKTTTLRLFIVVTGLMLGVIGSACKKNDTIVKELNVPVDEKHGINGYTITLHFNNGVSKRISFAFMVTIKKVFRITERTYTKD